MLKLWKLPRKCRDLAQGARAIAGRRDVLYHGTRYPRCLFRHNVLFSTGDQVAFTRSPEVAAYFSSLDRDDDEGRGAILVFDRRSLQSRYRLEPWHDPIFDTASFRQDEMEERVWWRDIADVRRHLIGTVMTGRTKSRARKTYNNRRHELQIRLRVAGVAPALAFEIAGALMVGGKKQG